jgi:hypothetical protein
MRTVARFVLFQAAAIAALLLLLPSCVSAKVKPQVLFPPAALTWPAVEEDFDRGLADGVADGDLTTAAAGALRAEGDRFEDALEQRDLAGLRGVPWELGLQPWAARGVEDKLADGEIGPGVATSLRGQLEDFTTIILQLQGIF